MRFLMTTALLATLGGTAHAEMATYKLDPEHTTVFFTVDHIGYAKTLGLFTAVEGGFEYDAETRELVSRASTRRGTLICAKVTF